MNEEEQVAFDRQMLIQYKFLEQTNATIKKMYEMKEKTIKYILDHAGKDYKLTDKQTEKEYFLQDVFAENNTIFRAKAFSRYELKVEE